MGSVAQWLAFLLIVSYSWTTIRIGELSIFDGLSAVLLPLFLYCSGKRRYRADPFLIAVMVAMGLLTCGVLIAAVLATDINSHLARGFSIVIAMAVVALALSLIVQKGFLSPPQFVMALCLSTGISAIFVILQGRFGLFTSLIPNLENGWQDWSRATGLAQHPVETAIASATGASLSLAMLLGLTGKTAPLVRCLLFFIFLIDIYSMQYSASLTAVISLSLSLMLQLFVARRFLLLGTGLIVGVAIVVGLSGSDGALAWRLGDLVNGGAGNYKTVGTRVDQYHVALDQIDPQVFLFGKGYNPEELPDGLEIHDGLIASDFHFGIFGLFSQLFLLGFITLSILRASNALLKAALISVFFIFISLYLSGPVLSRRSIWVPILSLCALNASSNQRARNKGGASYPRRPLRRRPQEEAV